MSMAMIANPASSNTETNGRQAERSERYMCSRITAGAGVFASFGIQ